MKRSRIIYFLLALLFTTVADRICAQGESEEMAVKQAVIDLFDAMRKCDTTTMRAAFVPNGRLMTAMTSKEGVPGLHEGNLENFLQSVGKQKGHLLDEVLTSWDIIIDQNLASVWTGYLFYYDGNFSHCGVDAYQMVKIENDWKIIQLIDTRQKEGCITDPKDHLDAFLNAWHHAAAVADADNFFGKMTEDGIYIGTDPTERWKRDEIKEWSKEYFDKESAWAFTSTERNINVDTDGKIAWFDELLDTWMGPCRGSGFLALTDDGWKIKQYHLALAVPNDALEPYMKMVEELKKGNR